MAPENAEILGLRALQWIASEEAVMQAFLNATGSAVAEIGARSSDPEFLGSVLEFLMASDANILEFSVSAGITPESIAEARAALPGGEVFHWT